MFVLSFLARRLAQGAVIISLVSLLIFTLLRVVPGDPVRLMVGGMAPDSLVEKIATEMGLRDPILVQFGRYAAHVVRGISATASCARRTGRRPAARTSTTRRAASGRPWPT